MSQALTAGLRGPTDFLIFEVAGQRYGLPTADSREVLPRAALAALPEAPAGLAGILRLRGQLLPVIDLRPRLGLPPVPPSITQRFVVISAVGLTLGLIVDAVDGLAMAGELSVPAAPHRCDGPVHFVAHDSQGVVTVLNPAAIVGAEIRDFVRSVIGERAETPVEYSQTGGRAGGDA